MASIASKAQENVFELCSRVKKADEELLASQLKRLQSGIVLLEKVQNSDNFIFFESETYLKCFKEALLTLSRIDTSKVNRSRINLQNCDVEKRFVAILRISTQCRDLHRFISVIISRPEAETERDLSVEEIVLLNDLFETKPKFCERLKDICEILCEKLLTCENRNVEFPVAVLKATKPTVIKASIWTREVVGLQLLASMASFLSQDAKAIEDFKRVYLGRVLAFGLVNAEDEDDCVLQTAFNDLAEAAGFPDTDSMLRYSLDVLRRELVLHLRKFGKNSQR